MKIDGGRAKATTDAVAKKARELASQFGGAWTMTIVMSPPTSARLGWFNDGTNRQPARPVLTLDGRARETAVEAITTRLRADAPRVNVLVAFTAGANAIRAVYVDRLSQSGADLTLAPLSPAYAMRKHLRGLDPRTGVATGETLRAVQTGRVTVSKTR